jgi:Lar family restriction alleviation protein
MEELKKCPFCGSTSLDFDIKRDALSDFEEQEEHFVFCDNCGAQGGSSLGKEGAVENWNRRKA